MSEVNKDNLENKDPQTGAEGTAGQGEGATKSAEEIKAEVEAKLKADYEKEVDRRVTEAIKKREKALKDEFTEKERKAKLTEEQRKAEEEQKKASEIAQKERELSLRALKLDLVDTLSENQMDLRFRDLITIEDLVNIEVGEERVEQLQARVKQFNSIFTEIVDKRIEEAKKEFLKGEPPKNLNNGNVTPPTAYETAKKTGNVLGMLSEKLNGKPNK